MSSFRERQDHPRIRGEHLIPVIDGCCLAGSSPHTRGAQTGDLRDGRYQRIIPAYAGSTGLISPGRRRCRDHPRIRGEHPARTAGPGCRRRIIPAYAGSTILPIYPAPTARDHPRIRGEHPEDPRYGDDVDGSSPHTRGARDHFFGDRFGPGIIPAYAGSTPPGSRASSSHRDHPRIRGEHSCRRCRRRRPGGSSPHTRGARCPGFGGRERRRIIPAYAGST